MSAGAFALSSSGFASLFSAAPSPSVTASPSAAVSPSAAAAGSGSLTSIQVGAATVAIVKSLSKIVGFTFSGSLMDEI